METFVSQHHGLLGTVIQARLVAENERAATAAEEALIAEMERLQRVFNVFDDESEVSRWRRGEVAPGAELVEVLGLANHWHRASSGAFDPYVGRLREAWSSAAAEDREPTEEELTLARSERDIAGIDLNAIAKGWIVDRAVETASRQSEVHTITVNGGGDIRHQGQQRLLVAIEDPHRPYDNAAPLAVVDLGDGAIATSGNARRGWTIGGRWYSHVLDPRTGRPCAAIAQVSVLAADAATTDAVATTLTVLAAGERREFLQGLDEALGYLIVTADGETIRNHTWQASEVR